MRVVLAEDSVLFREGLVRLLSEGGHDVVAAVGDADALVAAVDEHRPDLALIDVRMPPTMTDDGARAAPQSARDAPGAADAPALAARRDPARGRRWSPPARFGYLLKDRVLRVDDFLDAVRRVAEGGSALDPAVVGALLSPTRRDGSAAPLLARGSGGARARRRGPVQRGDRRAARRWPSGRWRPTCEAIFQKLRIIESGDRTAGSSRCSRTSRAARPGLPRAALLVHHTFGRRQDRGHRRQDAVKIAVWRRAGRLLVGC